jgi:hypothetical protein
MRQVQGLLAIALCVCGANLAYGQGTISASPAIVELRGVAGQSTTQPLLIANSTNLTMTFEMKARDVITRDGKRVFVDAGALPGSIAATAVFSRKLVTIPPGGSARVDVTLTIPPKPAARAVIAVFQGVTKVPTGPMSMTASLGVLLVFTLSDNIGMNAAQLSIKPPTASSNLTVTQKCTNSGTEPFSTKGILAIVNAAGRLIGKTAVPERRLLPGEATDVKTEYAGDLAPGRYRALMTYDLGGRTVTSTADFTVR